MKRETAEKIMSLVNTVDCQLAEIGELANEIVDEALRKKIRRKVAGIIIDLYESVTVSVTINYPDLHPGRE